jgi:DNA-binding transcriptional LysR family regulator
MDRLETAQLTYFVAVAEELHFGRAADKLGIAQPPLSRAISRLERRMGVRLLERTSRRVALTPAGKVFLAESRKALKAVDTAVWRAQQAARPHRLVVAVRSGTGSGLLPGVLAAYGSRKNAAAIEVVFTKDQASALRDGTADVALVCGSDDLSGLETTELMAEGPVALLPAGHRLAGRAAVMAGDLRQEETFREECPAVGLDEIVDMVALGKLIVIVGESAADRVGNAVVPVPVADLPGTLLMLAWGNGLPTAALKSFVDTATSVAAEASQALTG